VICPNCATENEAGRKFCLSCGSRLAIVCPGCGSPNNPLARFCGECGAAMATVTGPHAAVEGAAPAPGATMIAGSLAAGGAGRAAPLAERRLVTVLFVDLVGFTSLAEGRDAEVVRDLLGRYFEVARSVVEHHGGTVEKFIGDAVMAVWGAPTAHEDDAERAVRAALEIVDAVRALGPGLEARAGVLTGEAAVTLGAPGQGMVAGDLVNTASRLQSVAPPGSVVVGEATERAASRAIAFEPAGEQLLKGRVAPVQAYRALRVVAERGGRGRSDTLEAPFVGRTEEFRLLKELFHTTARERRVRHVSITGIAGIGKSRLAWEFLKYVDGLVEDTYWHEGRSPAYGEGITFWALGEMVRRRAGLAEADDERTTREKIAAALSRFVPDEAERHWIEPRLLTLLGLEVSVSGGREELFAAWRTFFERVAARGTVVLVFEDLQWADSGLLDFIDHVLEWSRAVPIYIVTLARPELLDRRPDWGAGRRNFTSIHLEPLSEAAMHQLLGGLVPGLPERAVAAMVARSEGVPLYAIETVRMLVSDGTLVAEGGSYRPTRDVSELAVPETLQALIAARLDALDPRERSLLQDASVLGQTFSVAGLAAVSDAAPEAAEANLRSLVRREFLQFVVDPRSPERGQYTFLQALIRDVAYGRLARKERRDRHLAAARYFEMLEDEEIAGVLASHYLAAYRASAEGPEADAAAAQARVALKSAADRASALGSPDQAMTYLERALSTATEPDDQADLLWRAGVAGSDAGHHEAAERFLRRAVEVNRDRGDRPAAARAVAALGWALVEGSRLEPAREVLEPAVTEYEDLGEDPAEVALLGHLSRTYFRMQQFEPALRYAEQALSAAERLGLNDVLADTLVTKGTALHQLGRSIEGTALLEAGLKVADAHGLTGTSLRAQNNLLDPLGEIDARAAFEQASRAFEQALRLGRAAMMVYLLENAVHLAMLLGEWEWADSRLPGAVAAITEDVDRPHILGLMAVLPRFGAGIPLLRWRSWRLPRRRGPTTSPSSTTSPIRSTGSRSRRVETPTRTRPPTSSWASISSARSRPSPRRSVRPSGSATSRSPSRHGTASRHPAPRSASSSSSVAPARRASSPSPGGPRRRPPTARSSASCATRGSASRTPSPPSTRSCCSDGTTRRSDRRPVRPASS